MGKSMLAESAFKVRVRGSWWLWVAAAIARLVVDDLIRNACDVGK